MSITADPEREAFEAWADSRAGAPLRHSTQGDYDYPLGRLLWEAWQAGRAEIARLKEQPQQPVHLVSPVPNGALTGDALQAYQQCRAVAHMARALAEVHEARASILAHGNDAPVEIIGESTAEIMEMLGDLLSSMDAVDESDEWLDPVFEAAQARWPAPLSSQSGDQKQDQPECSEFSSSPSNSAGDEA